MKKMFKRIISSITALAMTMSLTGGVQLVSFADEADIYSYSTSVSIGGNGEADNDLALEYYIDNQLMGSSVSLFQYRSTAQSSLDTQEYYAYQQLCAHAKAIAAGEKTSSVLEVTLPAYTYSELGLANDADGDAITSAFLDKFSLQTIMDYLLADMPYDLYWFDKTTKMSTAVSLSIYSGVSVTVTLTVPMPVADGYGSGTTLNSRPAAVATALEKITEIKNKYAGKSDLEILTGYKDEICLLTDYNHTAADDDSTAYGDPWQLIYVFDGDDATTVVCEGYSKAFKYLCDLTTFDKEIYCYLVDGDMGGDHMWNIVQIGEEYYHVDVTNSDSGAVGSGGGLFLDGVEYAEGSTSIFTAATAGGSETYVFSTESIAMYPTETANLSATKYSEAATVTGLTYTGTLAKTSYYSGDTFDPTGLSFALAYSDGSTEAVDVSDITFSLLLYGDTSVTATCGDYSVEITGITVANNSMTGIGIKTAPDKTSYMGGEMVDLTGLVITVNYANGKTKDVAYDPEDPDMELLFTYSPIARLKDSDTEVTVTYYDFTASYPITVTKGTVTAAYAGNTEYEYGKHDTLKCSIHDGTEYTYDGESVFRIVDVNGNLIVEADGDGISGTLLNGTQYKGQATNNTVVFFNEENGFSVGEYTVLFKYLGCDYYEAFDDFVTLGTITIKQATPEITFVSVDSPETITVGTAASDITLDCISDIEGTITLDAGQTLKEGTNGYNWTFVPFDPTNYKNVTGTINITAEKSELTAAYAGSTTYTYGDTDELEVLLKDGETSIYEGTSVFKLYKSGDTTTPVVTSNGEGVPGIGQVATALMVFVNNGSDANIDAGTYDLYFEYLGSDNYAAKDYGKIAEITVNKAAEYEVNIDVRGPIYTTTNPDDVVMNGSATFGIPEISATHTGTVEFADDDVTLVAGYHEYNVIFTPDIPNAEPVETTISFIVTEDVLKNISVKTAPTNTEYICGDVFDPTGLVITAEYTSGNKEIAYTDANKGDFTFDLTTLEYDDTAVTVTYGGKTAAIDITVDKKSLTAVYNGATTFNYGEFTLIYCTTEDGTNNISEGNSAFRLVDPESKEMVFECVGKAKTGTDGSVSYTQCTDFEYYLDSRNGIDAGEYELQFKYDGSDNYEAFDDFVKLADITISKVVPEVEVTASYDGTLYTSSDVSDITLSATAANTAVTPEINVAGTVEFDGAIEFKAGTNDYPVIFTPTDINYDPVRTTVSIEVSEDTLESIAVTTAPDKLVYVEGDKLDTNGLVVTATYASGAAKEIDVSLLTFDPATLSKGDTSVTVSYSGKSATIDGLTVKGKLTADKFKFTAPSKLTYDGAAKTAEVEAADGVTGVGTITVNYYEGNTKLDSAPVDAGTYRVVIDVAAGDEYVAATNLNDESWAFTIEKAMPEISPSLASPSVVYDTTDVDSLVLAHGSAVEGTITFDGEITLSADVSSYPVIFTPTDTDNYNTATGNVTINVERDVITGIAVKTAPRTEYIYGDDFDPRGLVITATYKSGMTEDVEYEGNEDDFTITPDELTVAATAVTVAYAEKTADITITVAQATPDYTIPKNLTATYGDKLEEVKLPEGWSWNVPDIVLNSVGAGTQWATYDCGDNNYRTVAEQLSINVSPKTLSISNVTVNDKDYDGTTTAAVSNITFTGVLENDTIDYTATAEFADKNAGEDKNVTVTVTLSETNYVLDVNTFTATASISKADPDVAIPTTASAITSLPLSKAELPEGWVWKDAAVIPVDGSTYTATYTPDDTTNYNVLTAEITVSVSDCTHAKTTETVVEATCTTDGSKTVTCDVCEKTVSTEVIPAAHSWDTDYTVDAEATCTTEGQKSIHCGKCDEIKPDSEVAIPASHSWNTDYTVDTEATCTTEGQKSIHCTKCDEIKPDSEVAIPASHSWNEDYTANGTHHWIECGKCGETVAYGEHTSGNAPSSASCVICGKKYSGSDDSVDRPSELPGGSIINPVIPGVTQPQIMGENGIVGWPAISNELVFAQDGDVIVVDMNGVTKLPESILKDIEGRNIDLVLNMGSGIIWTINGETVTEPKNVDMRVSKNVKRIPVDVIDNVTGDSFTMEISLAHNGEFGFEAMLTISLGKKYNDKYANLYYYNRYEKAMEFIDCDLISKGEAQLIFGHASDYAIVIDEEALGDDVSSAAGITADNEEIGGTENAFSVVFVLPLVLAAGFVLRKKLCN